MRCSNLGPLLLAAGILVSPVLGQQAPVQDSPDLHVEFRSATGSNRFRVGEVIPLVVSLSSTTPSRYLEPCALFNESGYGFPRCRFLSQWSFALTPEGGWLDFGGPTTGGGEAYDVPNRDLTSQPATFSYVLTHRYRVEKPAEYRLRLSMLVGLDDETTQLKSRTDPSVLPTTVTVTRDIMLQIVPAEKEWQDEIVREGEKAYAAPRPPDTSPPSKELLEYGHATRALCTVGTPEAARFLARLLAEGKNEVRICLERSASRAAAIEEMQRLLIDPDTAVTPDFFQSLVSLIYQQEVSEKASGNILHQQITDIERNMLVASFSQKHGSARYLSLLAVLQSPPRVIATDYAPPYELPFSYSVIAVIAADFDHLPADSQEWLLRDAWNRVASPLMLPIVRRKAESGYGPALLHWLELDPDAAKTLIRYEIVRPQPRFSSYYLRLPETSLPGQERQIAKNFIALTNEADLVRGATLLHRYATRRALPIVQPFIDASFAQWPCALRLPVLAYLLKVSPSEAASRVAQTLHDESSIRECTNSFLTDLGYLEPSPVLQRLAIEQIKDGGSAAVDGANYLKRYGSPAAKSEIWQQLQHWHQQFVSSGAEKRFNSGAASKNDMTLSDVIRALTEAFEGAQAWLLSPEEAHGMQALLGTETVARLACKFHCGASFAVNPVYEIRGQVTDEWEWRESPMDYLNPVERLHYSIKQYRCPDLQALKQKLSQFPKGAAFTFALPDDFTALDRDEMLEIRNFLLKRGYKLHNSQDLYLLTGRIN